MIIHRTLKKSYPDRGDVKVDAYLLEGDHYSEVKFYMNGYNTYTVSAHTTEELLHSFEKIEKTFFDAFFGTIHEEVYLIEKESKLTELGFKFLA